MLAEDLNKLINLKSSMSISVVIPVYNEKGRLEDVINGLVKKEYEIIVVDDGSTTLVESYLSTELLEKIKLLRNEENRGYIYSVKRGIKESIGDIIVTLDADGEHKTTDIEKLIKPISEEKYDIVFGKRPLIARTSEKILSSLVRILTKERIHDSGTGFRAIKATFAKKLDFHGKCTCGTLLLECHSMHMKVYEVDVELPAVIKHRRIAWEHIPQFFIVLKYYFQIVKDRSGKFIQE